MRVDVEDAIETDDRPQDGELVHPPQAWLAHAQPQLHPDTRVGQCVCVLLGVEESWHGGHLEVDPYYVILVDGECLCPYQGQLSNLTIAYRLKRSAKSSESWTG